MSDDLQAQIKEMRDLAALTRGFFGVHPQSGADHLEEIADRIQAHLDRDRKMKAELANSLKGLAVDIGSVRLELTSTKALDSPRLDFVQSELLKEAAKLEAADSKTEASEK